MTEGEYLGKKKDVVLSLIRVVAGKGLTTSQAANALQSAAKIIGEDTPLTEDILKDWPAESVWLL